MNMRETKATFSSRKTGNSQCEGAKSCAGNCNCCGKKLRQRKTRATFKHQHNNTELIIYYCIQKKFEDLTQKRQEFFDILVITYFHLHQALLLKEYNLHNWFTELFFRF
ncbi:unnamed protein product [Amoebophrya sp. A120]|nr:unnamed protein product [Amoebophrya sp. A120]|eukprot:GSA120T00008088001.1